MAARKTKFLSDEHRLKIQTSQLINRLTSFVNGEIKLEAAQVTAALGLLKKSLPDLAAIELSQDPENPAVTAEDVTEKILKQIPSAVLEQIIQSRGQDESPSNLH